MSRPLILDSIEIRGFRAFQQLLIERLGRVNLIVGKNNVGKTALLEALWLYAHRGSPRVIFDLLEARSELSRSLIEADVLKDRATSIKHLFYGRKDIRQRITPIEIGPAGLQTQRLEIALRWYGKTGEGLYDVNPLGNEEDDLPTNTLPAISVRRNDGKRFIYSLDDSRMWLSLAKLPRCNLVPAIGWGAGEQAEAWDRIALTNLEADVITALQIIAPQVERVNMLSDVGNSSERIAKAKMANSNNPIPLRSLGEGMNRLFGLALALVDSKDGMWLVDEIESGLHYSVQPDVWRLIFETARRLNVQVFATTHSWDCIEAFQQAAAENKEEEGILIRLEERKGKIVATEFDERRLGIATREEIEVR